MCEGCNANGDDERMIVVPLVAAVLVGSGAATVTFVLDGTPPLTLLCSDEAIVKDDVDVEDVAARDAAVWCGGKEVESSAATGSVNG